MATCSGAVQGCGPRGTLPDAAPTRGVIDRPPSTVVFGPGPDFQPAIDPTAHGPRGAEPDIDDSTLPEDPALLPSPVVRWERPYDEQTGVPSIVGIDERDGVVIVQEWDDGLAALELATGEIRWTFPMPEASDRGYSHMRPLLSGGPDPGHAPGTVPQEPSPADEPRVLAARGRRVCCVTAGDGTEQWCADLPWTPGPDAFRAGDLFVLAVEPDRPAVGQPTPAEDACDVVALDAATGAVAWTAGVPTEFGRVLPMVAVTPQFTIVVKSAVRRPLHLCHPENREAADPELRSKLCGDVTRVAVLRTDTGRELLSRSLDVVPRRAVASGDLLVLQVLEHQRANGDPAGDVGPAVALGAWRLPGLEPAWTLPLGTVRSAEPFVLAGPDMFVTDGSRLLRVEIGTGRIVAASEVSRLPLATTVDQPLAVGVAGNSLLIPCGLQCERDWMVLLDGASLHPWRVLRSGRAATTSVQSLAATGDAAVVGSFPSLVAFDLSSIGPPLRETKTVRETMEDAVAAVSWDERSWPERDLDGFAREIAQGGAFNAAAVRALLAEGTVEQRVFALLVLAYRFDEEAVPILIDLLRESPTRSTAPCCSRDLELPVRRQCRMREWSAGLLARSASPAAIEALLSLGDTTTCHELVVGRSAGLVVGSREGMRRFDETRSAARQWAEPWQPSPLPDSDCVTEGEAGPQGADGCREGQDRCRRTLDGGVIAFVAQAIGTSKELWLAGPRSGGEQPLFGGLTASARMQIESVEAIEDGVRVTVRRTTRAEHEYANWRAVVAESAERSGDPVNDYCFRFDEALRGLVEPETATFLWADLRRDTDGDGWSDVVECDLHTDPERADTDADTVVDPHDPAPRGAMATGGSDCSPAEALAAGYLSLALTLPGDMTLPLPIIGESDLNIHYSGATVPVLWQSVDEAPPLDWPFDKASSLSFGSWPTWPAGLEERDPATSLADLGIPDGARWTVVTARTYSYDHCGTALASVLKCIDGHWYPVAADGWTYAAD